jgi:hypothetical protein
MESRDVMRQTAHLGRDQRMINASLLDQKIDKLLAFEEKAELASPEQV